MGAMAAAPAAQVFLFHLYVVYIQIILVYNARMLTYLCVNLCP